MISHTLIHTQSKKAHRWRRQWRTKQDNGTQEDKVMSISYLKNETELRLNDPYRTCQIFSYKVYFNAVLFAWHLYFSIYYTSTTERIYEEISIASWWTFRVRVTVSSFKKAWKTQRQQAHTHKQVAYVAWWWGVLHKDVWMKLAKVGSLNSLSSFSVFPLKQVRERWEKKDLERLPVLRLRGNLLSVSFIIICTIIILILIIP